MAIKKNESLAKIIKKIPGYNPCRDGRGFVFHSEVAQKAIDFFSHRLVHVKGQWADKNIFLEDWQKAIVANLFGWKNKKGIRRYREAFIYVPRKNGKSTLISGLANFVLFCDGERGAEIYSAAADRDQASLVFEIAKGMILRDELLSKAAKIYTKAIIYEEEGSSYRAISADANTKHGFNTHLALIDELHAQPNRELVDVLITSTGARQQPMIIHITTADYYRESICNEKYDYARKVRDGIIKDESFLPVIYEADKDDDWTKPKTWAKANPNLGVSISKEYLDRECKRAQESSAYENTFKRLHLNIITEQATRWIQMNKWDNMPTFDAVMLRGDICYGGLDIASTTDIAAFVLVFYGDKCYKLLSFFWVPEENAHTREKKDRVPYLTWARDGHIKMTEGNIIDQDVIRHDINEMKEIYNIKEIAIDRWNSAQLSTQLMGDGFEVIGFGQGFASMTAPTKEMDAAITGKKILHNNHPVLRWMASNAAIETDAAGNMKPSKKKSSEKIDGIVAAIMALGRLIIRQEGEEDSVYDDPKEGLFL